MTGRAKRREDLKERLVDAAEARILASGLAALRARDVTTDAGCALGALYNAFADMDDLVLQVNSRTMAKLAASLREGVDGTQTPGERMRGLARAYLAFARANRTLWAAMFDHRLAPGKALPEWHMAEQAALIEHLVAPLAMLQPDLDQSALLARARTLFSAVHGIVTISLEERFVGLAAGDLDGELDRFVDILAAGIERGARHTAALNPSPQATGFTHRR